MSPQEISGIAQALALRERDVRAVLSLLDEGATVPFIARYRKEATGGLDEVQIRAAADAAAKLRALAARRETICAAIEQQGKLTPELRAAIEAAGDLARLEDLYAPYKQKRRTRAVMAKERGLEPLADRIWRQPSDGRPEADARGFVTGDVPDVEAALAGARDICAERLADDARAREAIREVLSRHGRVVAKKSRAARSERTKFDDYASFDEALRRLPPHRYLALCRGEAEGVLRVGFELDDEERTRARLERIAGVRQGSAYAAQLRAAVADGLARLLLPRAVTEIRATLKEQADRDAVNVFAANLKSLLLAAPFGAKPVLGIDPGQRTGCKCAVVSATGELLAHDTIFLVQGREREERAKEIVARLVARHGVVAVAVGNGTHGRETEAFARDALRQRDGVVVVLVNEAGASVYSASEVARDELPDVDVTVRGAVSIARRLQDPLAELVKIDPKSIGVGQYQHDVDQRLLAAELDAVVEDCVSSVGVELNTASTSLLARIAGLGPTLAKRLVAHRRERGRFGSRRELLDVSGLGPKTFEQVAGFLRIRDARHPLDGSAVHPERYGLVAKIAKDVGVELRALIGNEQALARIDEARYRAEVGELTFADIVAELHKPGRDPRDSFAPPAFRDDVRSLSDLREGMRLEGVVTNVTNFGAFVDVGVKQDGLVHVSQLADRFVEHPSQVVTVGDRVKVTVLSVDHDRKRIGLSMRQQ